MTEILTGPMREIMVAPLLNAGWKEVETRDAIEKSFEFHNFADAFTWMTRVAMVSERHNHHPEWYHVYNRVHVILTTYAAGGLSEADLELAQNMDDFKAQLQ